MFETKKDAKAASEKYLSDNFTGNNLVEKSKEYIKYNLSQDQIDRAKVLIEKSKDDAGALQQFFKEFPSPYDREPLIILFSPKIEKEEFKAALEKIFQEEREKSNIDNFTPGWTKEEVEISRLATDLRDKNLI